MQIKYFDAQKRTNIVDVVTVSEDLISTRLHVFTLISKISHKISFVAVYLVYKKCIKIVRQTGLYVCFTSNPPISSGAAISSFKMLTTSPIILSRLSQLP